MISRKIKLLVAAVSLVALATTVGFASTMHIHAKSAHQTQGSGSKAVGLPLGENASPHHGILTCGSGTTTAACEQLEMMLPMSVINWGNPSARPTDI
jgi:hypothetical protein